MPKKRAKKTSPRKPRRAAAKRSGATKREQKAFIKSLIAHGQAVAVRPGQKLPPGATHKLIKDDAGEVTVVRKRFSAI